MQSAREKKNEILNEKIRNTLMQYPLSDDALSNSGIPKTKQLISKVMEINKKLMRLTQLEFQALTGEKTSKQNATFCKEIAELIITSVKEANASR